SRHCSAARPARARLVWRRARTARSPCGSHAPASRHRSIARRRRKWRIPCRAVRAPSARSCTAGHIDPAAACAGPNDSPWSFLPAPRRSLRSTLTLGLPAGGGFGDFGEQWFFGQFHFARELVVYVLPQERRRGGDIAARARALRPRYQVGDFAVEPVAFG